MTSYNTTILLFTIFISPLCAMEIDQPQIPLASSTGYCPHAHFLMVTNNVARFNILLSALPADQRKREMLHLMRIASCAYRNAKIPMYETLIMLCQIHSNNSSEVWPILMENAAAFGIAKENLKYLLSQKPAGQKITQEQFLTILRSNDSDLIEKIIKSPDCPQSPTNMTFLHQVCSANYLFTPVAVCSLVVHHTSDINAVMPVNSIDGSLGGKTALDLAQERLRDAKDRGHNSDTRPVEEIIQFLRLKGAKTYAEIQMKNTQSSLHH